MPGCQISPDNTEPKNNRRKEKKEVEIRSFKMRCLSQEPEYSYLIDQYITFGKHMYLARKIITVQMCF